MMGQEHLAGRDVDPSTGGVEVSELVAETPVHQSDEPPIQGPEERQREELRMLMIGFGTGLTVAGIFLLYVVLDIAKLL